MDRMSAEREDGHRRARLGFAVAAPLAALAAAYVLWRMSNELLWIGPLDRAAFGWLVVVPVWALAPVAAASASRALSMRASAFVNLGLAIGVAVPVAVVAGNRPPSLLARQGPSAHRRK